MVTHPNAEPSSFSCHYKRRAPPEDVAGGADGRRMRKMRNREATVRSRKRKQVYTVELEMKAADLKDENAKLKKQCDELRLSMATEGGAKRSTSKRSSTAPL